ncbi:MAG: hypothetical protein J7J91_11920 [Deltaproteobacteria bacterium]|nr:hypothetical protein [Deltaproteobacteria bacterium]
MGERVKTKTLKNGRKLVVVKIGKNFEYAPRYSDIREIIRQLCLLYGRNEVFREILAPDYYPSEYEIERIGKISDDELIALRENYDKYVANNILEGNSLIFFRNENECFVVDEEEIKLLVLEREKESPQEKWKIREIKEEWRVRKLGTVHCSG